MASKQKVNCSKCGRELSKSGIRLHEQYCKQELNETTKQSSNEKNDLDNQERGVVASTEQKANKKYNEVNMTEQYEVNKKQIEPTKQSIQEEYPYECGGCGEKLKSKVKFCPSCGVGFE